MIIFCSGRPALKQIFWGRTDLVFHSKESSDHFGMTKKNFDFWVSEPARLARPTFHQSSNFELEFQF